MENKEMYTIDVEKIMEEIREDIKRKGYVDDFPEFEDTFYKIAPSHKGIFDVTEYQEQIQYLNENWNIPVHRNFSGQGTVGKIKVIIQKGVRKCIKFYVRPIIDDQNKFNARVTSSFNIINLYIAHMQEENEALKKRIEQLENERKK